MADLYDPYGNPMSDPGFIDYQPQPLPDESPGTRYLDDSEIPVEVYKELRRRWAAVPRRTAERKRGIVEYTDPKTGKTYRMDRYGEQVQQGFHPLRDRAPLINAFKYLFDQEAGKLNANRAAQSESRRAREAESASDLRRYGIQESGRRSAADTYNTWLARQRESDRQFAESQATQRYRDEMLGLRRQEVETSGVADRALAHYRESQADYFDRDKPKATPSNPMADWKTNDLVKRRDELEVQLYEMDAAGQKVGGMTNQTWNDWMPFGLGEPKPVTVGIGPGEYDVPYEQRGGFTKRLGGMQQRAKGEYDAINQELERRGVGVSGPRSSGVPPLAPSHPISDAAGRAVEQGYDQDWSPAAGPARDRAMPGNSPTPSVGPQPLGGPAAMTEAPPGLREQSWSAATRRRKVTMPDPKTLDTMDPKHSAFYAILEDLKQQGLNINAVTVQQFAAKLAEQLVQEDMQRRGEEGYEDLPPLDERRPPGQIQGP